MRLHGKLPEDFYGERLFAEACTKFLSEDSDAWFNVHLPKVGEIDAVVLIPEVGIFLTEIKGHSLSQISNFINSEIIEYPNPNSKISRKSSPIIQIMKARNGLKNYLDVKSKSFCPWLNVSVALPRINRIAWQEKYGIADGSDAFFFEEELSDKDRFLSHFTNLIENPLRGLAQSSVPNQKRMDLFRTVLMKSMNREVSEYRDGVLLRTDISSDDREKAVFAERGFSKNYFYENVTIEEEKRILQPASKIIKHSKDIDSHEANRSPEGRLLIEISGNPGSGKTALLCNWTRRKLVEGKDVLYITYNKTLAAEIRRLMYGFNSPTIGESGSSNPEIQIFDAFEFRKFIEDAQSFSPSKEYSRGEDYQKSFEKRTKSLYDGKPVWPTYTYIAIDEAQDIPVDVLSMIKSSSTSDAIWLVASDLNQKIYRNDEPDYSEESQQYHRIRLNVSSSKEDANRVTEEVSKFQSEINKNYLMPQKAIEGISKVLAEKKLRDEERILPEEIAPYIKLLNKPQHQSDLNEKIRIIYGTNGHRQARSLLIIANRSDHPLCSEVKRSLRDLKLPFNDSFNKDSSDRRKSINKGEIHLVTVHSARGLEADRVIVIGLSEIKDDDEDRALANIALTRAKIETIVIRDRSSQIADQSKSQNALQFLESICEANLGFVDDTQF